MNHIYRVVYNSATNTYQAVPENSTGKHKTASEKSSCAVSDVSEKGAFFSLKPMAFAMAMGLSSTGAWAAPTGGHISAGDASIAQHGKITNIQQNSQKAAINWQSFGIKADETVNFKQPNAQAVILNRVIGNEKSVIDGAMNANGKVFISNPNGMIIGKNAQINVGALLATTAKIKDQDFMNGFFKFDQATGDITHLGDIKVPTDGVVALIAPIVANKGNITAPQGKVLLASAEQFSITLPDNGQFAYTLDRGTLQGLVDNGGAILADGGHVILTAKGTDAVKKSLIKHTGKIEANTVQNKNGVIELLGDLDNTRLEASGSLKAEAEHGDGGLVETSAAEVSIRDLSVSTKSKFGKTGEWLIDPKDFTVSEGTGEHTETGIGAKTLSENLQNTDVKIQTVATGSEKGDIHVNAPISWDKNKLTLSAHNDIHINKTLNGTGTAKLALEYGQGTANGKYKAIVDGKETELDNDYYLDKNTPLKDRTVKVNLPEGKNFSTKKGNKGEVHEFDVIHKMPEIVKNANGDWESQFTERNIALGTDIDVNYTKDYKGFAGWKLAKYGSSGLGLVAGLGHDVSNLYLHSKKDNQPTGLFQENNYGHYSTGYLNLRGYLRDIGVLNAQVYSEGAGSYTGGLVGNASLSNILNSYTTGNVSSTGHYAVTGGLVGTMSTISNSYSTGSVSSTGFRAHAGGLAGAASNISNSYATGSVSSTGEQAGVGGLLGGGSNYTISNSYATGSVSSTGIKASTGGLVGNGLGSTISNSYATGSVSSTGEGAYTGGLIGNGGYTSSTISNSYANNSHLSATGKGSVIGGFLGYPSSNAKYKNGFFNQDKYPNLQAIGKISSNNPNITNITGKTEAQLKDRTTFEGWDFDKVWYMNDGEMPKLRAHKKGTIVITPTSPTTTPNTPVVTPTAPTNPTQPVKKTDLSIQTNNLNKVYDSKPVANESDLRAIAKENGYTDIVSITGLQNGDTLEKLGTLRYDGKGNTWQNAKNAGEYKIVPSGLTGGQDYEIKYGEGSLTIEKKPISVVASSVYDGTNIAKVYDEKDKFFENQMIGFNDVENGDEVSLKQGTSAILNSHQVGKTTIKDLDSLALIGNDAKNYTINKNTSIWNIKKRPIKVTGSREYNGNEWINGVDLNIDKSNIIGNDEILLNVYTGDAKLDGKDAQNGRKIVDTSKIYFGGKDGGNYEIDKSRSSVDIMPKNISIEVSKEYDGTNEFTKDFKIKGIIDDENPNIHISKATVAGKDNISNDVDYDKFTSISIDVPDKNYQFDKDKSLVSVRIEPKEIVITPNHHNQSLRFNQDDHKDLTYTHTSLIGKDKITGYLEPENPNVGIHKIGLGTLSAGKNYKLLLEGDKYIKVVPIPLTIQAIDQSYNTASNVFSGIGAKDSFNRKLFNIIKDKNLKYPAHIPYFGGLELENERNLQLVTATNGKYNITKGNLDFYDNYDVKFIPATYTVYTDYHNPIANWVFKKTDVVTNTIEGGVLSIYYPIHDGVKEDLGEAVGWSVRIAEDIEGLPLEQKVAIIAVGGVAMAGELAQAGLKLALSKATMVVLTVKGLGTYTIDKARLLGMSDEQIKQFTKQYQMAVDLASLLYSMKDLASLKKMDTKQIEEYLKKELKKQGFTGKEAVDYIKYWRSVGAITNNGIQLNRENILSFAYDFYSYFNDISK